MVVVTAVSVVMVTACVLNFVQDVEIHRLREVII